MTEQLKRELEQKLKTPLLTRIKNNQQKDGGTMTNESSDNQKEGTKVINMRYPSHLLEAIEEFQKEKAVSTRTNAIFNLLEIGLNAVNGIDYVKKPDIPDLPCTTLRELQILNGMKRFTAHSEKNDFACISVKELMDLEDLTLDLSTILSNLNFYKDRLKNEGYTALADMGELAYKKL